MTTPQPVLDRVAELEQLLLEKQEEIARYSTTISRIQEAVLESCHQQDEVQNRLDLLRFVIEQYEAQNPLPMPDDPAVYATTPTTFYPSGADETTGNGSKPASTKERVYAAMGQLDGPVTATQIAEAIGAEDYRTVAPVFGALHKEGKIKPAPSGGWVRTEPSPLGMVMEGM